MKRQTFRLTNVLNLYELRKKQAEMELANAGRLLQKLEGEIATLDADIIAVARMLRGPAASNLSTTAWIAAYGKTQHLDRQRQTACERRDRQAEAVAALKEKRKKWAIAEESLRSLRHQIDLENRAAADQAQQLLLDETVLRQWGDSEAN